MPVSLLSLDEVVQKRRGLRRRLLSESGPFREVRVAVLSGSTTHEQVELLELFLLERGLRPVFWESAYGRYYESAVLEPELLAAWKPDLVYLHTCWRNAQGWPPVDCTEAALTGYVDAEAERWRAVWQSLHTAVGCLVIQNNFEMPLQPVLGNLDSSLPGGRTRFVCELNRRFAQEAAQMPWLHMQDLAGIAGTVGLARWHDPERWFSYKLANSVEGSVVLARSLAAMVAAAFGQTRKVLVLDLDNTLWGGVVGDEGVDKIRLGAETPTAEAYSDFQRWCLSLRERGVLLAVCSKNDEATARAAFLHPDSVLKLEHFSSFRANWRPKHENIYAIARELDLSVDSFVFVDDNPAERAIVEAQVPGIAVPEIGADVTRFADIISRHRYFEAVSLGQEDMERAQLYAGNVQRAETRRRFADYGEYLDSLAMVAEVEPFRPVYLERIAQLTNKTNQFNLTTRRYTVAEIEAASHDPAKLGLYGRLRDRFSDNGLVSVVLGTLEQTSGGTQMRLDLWLMSCRVLKREMEFAMLDRLVSLCRARGVHRLVGSYVPSGKNAMVAEHYACLGFTFEQDQSEGVSLWTLELEGYAPKSKHIQLVDTM